MATTPPKICIRCNLLKSNFPQCGRKISRYGITTNRKRYCADCHASQERVVRQLRKIHAPPPPHSPCECCGRAPLSLQLDHDHRSTGEVAFRGWLCRECNVGLGFLGDDADGLEQALMYLCR
jgi:hypothetical protein